MKKFAEWWRSDPKVRVYVRIFVVGVISYVIAALAQGGEFGDLSTFGWAAAGAGAKALVAVLTPEEPFVGIKASQVEVPSPPAVRDTP